MPNDNVHPIHKPVEYSFDGRQYSTDDRRQPAADILTAGGVSPAQFDLGELVGHRPEPKRYADDEIVEIHDGSRFVSIRQRADVA